LRKKPFCAKIDRNVFFRDARPRAVARQKADYLREKQCALEACTQERSDLNNSIEVSVFEGVPSPAISHLRAKCSPEQLPSVAQYLKTDKAIEFGGDLSIIPEALWPAIIDDCVAKAPQNAEIAAKTAQREENAKTIATKEDANEQRRTRNIVVTKLQERHAGKNGRAFLEAIRADVLTNKPMPDPKSPDGLQISLSHTEQKELLGEIDAIATTLDEMSGVFVNNPAASAAFNQIIASAQFDLTADSMEGVFAPVLSQIDSNEAFSKEDKTRLHNIVTGTDVQDALAEKNADGSFKNTEDNKREFRTGVSGYTEPSGRQIIEAKVGNHPAVIKDVSGWSGEDIGLLVEVMHYWNTTESFGTTGFVENIYKIDFSILDSGGAFDPLTVNSFRQVISHMMGGFAGYDGDIENFEHKQRLIQNQSRLLSDTQTAFGWENSQSGTTQVLQRLGLENANGHPNLEVIAAFGDYTQENYAKGQPDQLTVVDYLSRLYPQFVAPVSEVERKNDNLDFSGAA